MMKSMKLIDYMKNDQIKAAHAFKTEFDRPQSKMHDFGTDFDPDDWKSFYEKIQSEEHEATAQQIKEAEDFYNQWFKEEQNINKRLKKLQRIMKAEPKLTIESLSACTTDEQILAFIDDAALLEDEKRRKPDFADKLDATDSDTMAASLIRKQLKGAKEEYLTDLKVLWAAGQKRQTLLQDTSFREGFKLIKQFRKEEYWRAFIKVSHLKEEIEKYKDRRDNPRVEASVVENRHEIQEKIDSLEQELVDFTNENPEAFILQGVQKINEMKRAFNTRGKIVETKYVKERAAVLERMLFAVKDKDTRATSITPVFIHGNLGTGKTEVARYLSQKKLSAPYVKRFIAGDAESGLDAHPKPKRSDYEEGKEHDKDYKDALKKWKERIEMAKEPLMISGFRDIGEEIIIGGIKIERKSNALSVEALMDQMEDRKKQWTENFKKRNEGNEPDPTMLESFQEAMLKALQRPVETVPYMGKFYKAMYEGRPLIIDEMNAIPHHILILLNDLLSYQEGQLVIPMIPGLEPFRVKKGFCVIGTGNWRSEGDPFFAKREKLDPAFLSRWNIMPYDYLPNRTDRIADNEPPAMVRKLKSENELYQMLLIRMMDDSGELLLPTQYFESAGVRQARRPENMFEDLARIARLLQNISNGETIKSEYYPKNVQSTTGETDPNKILKENVLSIRHLTRIIDAWRAGGFSRDLDDYIFLFYVMRSTKEPAEMHYIYQLLQSFGGFFPQSKGWPDGLATDGAEKIKQFNIFARMFGSKAIEVREKHELDPDAADDAVAAGSTAVTPDMDLRTQVERYSVLDAVPILFGPVPKRTEVRRLKRNEIVEEEIDENAPLTERDEAKELENIENIQKLKDQTRALIYLEQPGKQRQTTLALREVLESLNLLEEVRDEDPEKFDEIVRLEDEIVDTLTAKYVAWTDSGVDPDPEELQKEFSVSFLVMVLGKPECIRLNIDFNKKDN